jgi:hypothetical protein
MCSQCFTLLAPRSPLTVSCTHCDMAYFCTRLCRSKAKESAAHHDLLCPGQNKGALELLLYIHKTSGRHLEAAAKIVARWRGDREWAGDEGGELVRKRAWEGMARVNMETKEMERKEWYVCVLLDFIALLPPLAPLLLQGSCIYEIKGS